MMLKIKIESKIAQVGRYWKYQIYDTDLPIGHQIKAIGTSDNWETTFNLASNRYKYIYANMHQDMLTRIVEGLRNL